MKKTLEICAADLASVLAAQRGGADRVELCTALAEGGTTPSGGLIVAARDTGLPIHVLIRPRPGNFVYTPAEKAVIRQDIINAACYDVRGVVVGALTPDGDIDTDVVKAAHEAIQLTNSEGIHITFHRAFDRCRDPFEALEALIKLKVDYLLTSGQAASATEGAPLLAELVRRARGRIKIIAAAGINSANIAELAHATGCPEFHASARGAAEGNDPWFGSYRPTDASEVSAIVKALKS